MTKTPKRLTRRGVTCGQCDKELDDVPIKASAFERDVKAGKFAVGFVWGKPKVVIVFCSAACRDAWRKFHGG